MNFENVFSTKVIHFYIIKIIDKKIYMGQDLVKTLYLVHSCKLVMKDANCSIINQHT
jgi:hypothetical protein